MFRKIIFSKEPTALTMESMDSTVRLQMKNNQIDGIYSIEGTRDTFRVTKGTQEIPLVSSFIGNNCNAILQSDQLHASKSILTPQLIFQHITNDDEDIIKGVQSELYGIKYTLPSRFHSHRFMTRYAGNQYQEWMRIQQGRQGRAQVGIGTTVIDASVGLHVNGIIRCDKIMTQEPSVFEPWLHSNLLWLDDAGKIPHQYLPEQYQVSILQNEAGVGIGTRVPLQKLHVEGGCYIRDRIGIGQSQPNAIIHIANTTSTLPCLTIEQDNGNAIQVMHSPSQSTLFNVSTSKTHIGLDSSYQTEILGTLKTNTLKSDSLELPFAQLNESGIEFTPPVCIQHGLTCDTIQSSADISRPLSLHATDIQASNAILHIKDTVIPIGFTLSSHTTPLNANGLLEEMELLDPKLYIDPMNQQSQCGFIKEDFIQQISSGNETATLLFDGQNGIQQSTMLHILWKTVCQLSKRIKELEGQKS
jgi:hypothetical protein